MYLTQLSFSFKGVKGQLPPRSDWSVLDRGGGGASMIGYHREHLP